MIVLTESQSMNNETRWFASGGGITSTDGFPTQAEAYAAYRLTAEARKRQYETTGRDLPFPVDLVVWPGEAGGGAL